MSQLTSFDCPSFAVGCQTNPLNGQKYDGCCVSQDGLFVFAQNYTTGLSYDGLNRNWTTNSVVAEIGPRFTIHGLWPDNCDGTYNSTTWNANHTEKTSFDYDLYGCDATRAVQDAQSILLSEAEGSCATAALLDFMQTNWRVGNRDDNWFWSHEWSKHGTCASSYDPQCLDTSDVYAGLVDFFGAAVAVFKHIDLLAAFGAAGIVPSDSTTYNLTALNNAHQTAFGFPGGMQCVSRNGSQYLSEVWSYLSETPNHNYIAASPDLVVAGAYQSCKLALPITIPLAEAHGDGRKVVERLYVFDFDSTLFRSPQPSPQLWASEARGMLISECGWFMEPRTLSESLGVGVAVDGEGSDCWWEQQLLGQLRALRRQDKQQNEQRQEPEEPQQELQLQQRHDSAALFVLLTGRRHDLFHARISALANAAIPDHFDLVLLKELVRDTAAPDNSSTDIAKLSSPNTLDFKWDVLECLLAAFPRITRVDIWDDRRKHLDAFKKLLAEHPASPLAEMHLVVHDPNKLIFLPQDKELEMAADLVANANEKTKTALAIQSAAQTKLRANKKKNGNGKVEKNNQDENLSISFVDKVSIESTSTVGIIGSDDIELLSDHKKSPKQSSKKQLFILKMSQSIQYTGIFITPSSASALVAAVANPLEPSRSITNADHVTICLGPASNAVDIIQALGGLNATVTMQATAYGTSGEGDAQVTAVRVRETDGRVISKNEVAHCTLYVGVKGKARDSNFITEWREFNVPIQITGVVKEKVLWNLSRKKVDNKTGEVSDSPKIQALSKEVSVGTLIKAVRPALKGHEIGEAVKKVEDLMAKNGVENIVANSTVIEAFVSSIFE
ncbi:ribonuclease T2-like [Physocladia obscura]|uniref:ribonuclease T2 n=1 Tax=Physocladia obscura TaxID=109957 RepID=A0AAD5XCE5_9FUNG|nr:ribonuclease T2-like [Physocladia obscura]